MHSHVFVNGFGIVTSTRNDAPIFGSRIASRGATQNT